MNASKPLLVLMRSVAAGLCLFAMAQPALAQDAAKAPRKDLVLKGDAICTRCHGADEEYPVLEIGKTKHGTVADSRTPTCTSCHGASETHINRPAGVSERPKPTVVFSKKSSVPAEVQSQACLTCHGGEMDGLEGAPPLAGKPFMDRWGGLPVKALASYISSQMPPGNGGAVGANGETDIIAYILSKNGFPAGATALSADSRLQADVLIDKK